MAEAGQAEAARQTPPDRVERAPDRIGDEQGALPQRAAATIFQGGRVDPSRLTSAGILALQRTAGNTAVNQLLRQVQREAISSVQRDDDDDTATATDVTDTTDSSATPDTADATDTTDAGNPVAPPNAGTSIHPLLNQGTSGPAVEELQQKLNASGVAPQLEVDGQYGPLTGAGVRQFQQDWNTNHADQPILVDGIAGPQTWGAIDTMNLPSTVGRIEKTWSEVVQGHTYGMTSKYTWNIHDTDITVTVNLGFTGVLAPVPGWLDAIRAMWNRFDIVNVDTGDSLDLIFDPHSVSGGGADNNVEVKPGNQRSDAGTWYAGDPDSNGTACHEFGHMIGLEDAPAADIATQLNTALLVPAVNDRIDQSLGVISTHSIQQGQFAQAIAASYQTAFGIDVVQDIDARLPEADPRNPSSDPQYVAANAFTFSTGGLMGQGDDASLPHHEHPIEPRHVREFTAAVQSAKGGNWEARER
jgi:peptidoglycan hydrolase-like protein with peptidoglycan-binding domain